MGPVEVIEMTDSSSTADGGCLCGAVRYCVTGPLRDVVNCHCGMCQRLHGGFGPHSKAAKSDLEILSDEGLAWYQSSDVARRGFCAQCGSSLFWDAFDQDTIGILAGTLDQPTGLSTLGHIFVASKADFVTITDDLPQFDESSNGRLEGDYR